MGVGIELLADEVVPFSDSIKAVCVDGTWAIMAKGKVTEFNYSTPYRIAAELIAATRNGNIDIYNMSGDLLWSCIEDYEQIRATIENEMTPQEVQKYADSKKLKLDRRLTSQFKIFCKQEHGRLVVYVESRYGSTQIIMSNKEQTAWEQVVPAHITEVSELAGLVVLRCHDFDKRGDPVFLTDGDLESVIGPIYGDITDIKADKKKLLLTTSKARALSFGFKNVRESYFDSKTIMKSGIYKVEKTGKAITMHGIVVKDTGIFTELRNKKVRISSSNNENGMSAIYTSDGMDELGFEIYVESISRDRYDIVGKRVTDRKPLVYSCMTGECTMLDQYDKIETGFNGTIYLTKDGKTTYYKHGVLSNSLAFNYIAAKPLNTPMCKVKMYAGQLPSGSWMATDALGEPVDLQTYEFFFDIQEVYARKIKVPECYRFHKRQLFQTTEQS